MSSRPDRSGEFTGVLGLFITLTVVLVSLRCYCKLVIVKNFAIDDYLSVLTLVSFLVFCSSALLGIHNGTGKRRYLIPDKNYPDGMKWWWICEPTYVFTNITLKLSIGIFLLRIAVERTHRMILWVTLITIEVYSVFFLLLFTFQCWPVGFFWEQFRGGHGSCLPTKIVVSSFYGYSAVSCVTDWTFSIVPIFIVQKLQMNNKKKITVGIILAFCAVGSTATIVRLPYIKGLNDVNDFLYSTIDVAIWSTIETGIALGASAAATLRPLLRQVFGDQSTHDNSNRKSRNWGSTHPSRSGYLPHPSQGGDDSDIALKDQDPKFSRTQVVSGGGHSSRSGSTTGLRDWEHEKELGDKMGNHTTVANGIMKTVRITQT